MSKVKIGDVCSLKSGTSLNEDILNSSEGIPYVKVSDMNLKGNEKFIIRTNSYADYTISPKMIFPIGTIIFPKRGGAIGTNKKRITSTDVCADLNTMGVIPSDKLRTLYLYYYFQNIDFGSLCNGSSVPQINNTDIAPLEIPLIALEEQDKIAANLDKVTHTIELCNNILEKLDLLVKARFVEMFWEIDITPQKLEWIPISEIGTVVGGSTPKTSIEDFWDGDLKWITPAELLSDTGYLYDSVRKITRAGADSCSLQLLPKGTVILTSRAPIGKVAILGTEMYCNQGFKNIICNNMVIPRYLYSILLYNTDFLNSLGRGATFKEISKFIVEKIRIPVPTIELQKKFATFVEQTDKSKSAVKQVLEKAETLKKALMQEYFG